jgi:hypothetical protein
MPTDTGFNPKLLDEEFRVGAKATVHDYLVGAADPKGRIYTKFSAVAAATSLSKGATRNALYWLRDNGYASIETGNKARLTSIVLTGGTK